MRPHRDRSHRAIIVPELYDVANGHHVTASRTTYRARSWKLEGGLERVTIQQSWNSTTSSLLAGARRRPLGGETSRPSGDERRAAGDPDGALALPAAACVSLPCSLKSPQESAALSRRRSELAELVRSPPGSGGNLTTGRLFSLEEPARSADVLCSPVEQRVVIRGAVLGYAHCTNPSRSPASGDPESLIVGNPDGALGLQPCHDACAALLTFRPKWGAVPAGAIDDDGRLPNPTRFEGHPDRPRSFVFTKVSTLAQGRLSSTLDNLVQLLVVR